MEIPALRDLYMPVQPRVRTWDGEVSYQEFLPGQPLQRWVYCYWQLRTARPLSAPFSYRVVADGCIDIFFELNEPSESYLMGFCRKYTSFDLANEFNYIGIRFLPGMFPELFGINGSLLANRHEKLDSVLPGLAKSLAIGISPPADVHDIVSILDGKLMECLPGCVLRPDPRFYAALARILKHAGVIDVERDLDTGLSSRQLRRVFQFYIGDTPKTFSKVVRFQHILRAKPSVQSLRSNRIFFDAGYYDQAHFIKEFRTLYGVTPGKAFGR